MDQLQRTRLQTMLSKEAGVSRTSGSACTLEGSDGGYDEESAMHVPMEAGDKKSGFTIDGDYVSYDVDGGFLDKKGGFTIDGDYVSYDVDGGSVDELCMQEKRRHLGIKGLDGSM